MKFLNSKKNAYALSIVLWIVAAILFLTLAMSFFSKSNVSLSSKIEKKLITQIEAKSFLEILKYLVYSSEYDNTSFIVDENNYKNLPYNLPKIIYLDNSWYSISENLRFRIIDTSALLNVRTTSSKLLADYLAGDNFDLNITIKNSIDDWRDKDNFVNFNGSETLNYKNKFKVNYSVRNLDFIQSVDELRIINGINSISVNNWNILKEKLYFGNGSFLNLALLNDELLSLVLNLDNYKKEQLLDLRKNDLQKFIELVSKDENFNENYMSFHLSRQLLINIEVKIDDVKTILETLIDFRTQKTKIYTIISYRID